MTPHVGVTSAACLNQGEADDHEPPSGQARRAAFADDRQRDQGGMDSRILRRTYLMKTFSLPASTCASEVSPTACAAASCRTTSRSRRLCAVTRLTGR